MAWLDTGLATPFGGGGSNSASPAGAISLGGNIYVGLEDGSLHRSLGGTAAFTQLVPALANSSILTIFAFNGNVWAWMNTSSGARIYEWNGASAWTLRGTGATGIGGYPGNFTVTIIGSTVYLAAGARLFRYTVAGGLVALVDMGINGNGACFTATLGDGFIYVANNQNGRLYRHTISGGATSQVAAQYGGEDMVNIFAMGGQIYGVTRGTASILRFNGSNAWVLELQGPYVAEESSLVPSAVLVSGGRMYFVMGYWSSMTMCGMLLSWAPGEAQFRLEAERLDMYGCAALFTHGGALYGMMNSNLGFMGGFDLGKLFRYFSAPTTSRVLAGSTGRISHARILTVERTMERARYLFEIFKERTT